MLALANVDSNCSGSCTHKPIIVCLLNYSYDILVVEEMPVEQHGGSVKS